MSNELAKLSATGGSMASIESADVFQLGQVLYESKYFKDVSSASQAIVKILRGQELGIGPIAAMENVYVIEGRTALSYPLIGAQIKKSGRYDYRVLESTDDAAEIAFFEQGKEIGRSRFTLEDARIAELSGKKIWKQYPGTMCFARAMSQGARRYTPDVFGGAIYTPEELKDIKEPELAIDTTDARTGQTVDTTTGEITETLPNGQRPRPRAEKVQRYRELCIEAGKWNADESHAPIEHRLYSDAWTDAELQAYGTALATALDQATKTGVPGAGGEDARASVI